MCQNSATRERPLRKFVFIQNDPFHLPKLLDKYLREFHDSTVGVNIQSVSQGKRTVFQTAVDLWRIYGWRYFLWKLAGYATIKLKALIVNDILQRRTTCYSVRAVAAKYNIPVHYAKDVNSEEFRQKLRELRVDLGVSISGTQFFGRTLRDQIPCGIVNCHGALLPKYRGLMPSFWTLANDEREGGVTVHYVDAKIDNGPIVVQRRYRINPTDTLEEVVARSKDLAAEAVIEAVRLIEEDAVEPKMNAEAEATHFSMPTSHDARRFRTTRHRFV